MSAAVQPEAAGPRRLPTARDLALLWPHRSVRHGKYHHCPGCGEDCYPVAITRLAYTFELCDCRNPNYEHIFEQMWHRKCLAEPSPA